MPYQNNNNRLVPKEVGLTNITPVAHTVDTMVRYTPHTEAIANNYRNINQAIRDIGRGLYDVNNALMISSQTSAAKMMMNDNLINNNQHKWADASRNVEGIAKFNPYLKESYKQLAANDVAQQLINEAATIQNSEQMTPEGYKELMNLQRSKFLDYCRENNIPSRLAGGTIIGLQNQLNRMEGKQQVENAQYTYDVTLAAGNNEALTQLRGIAYNLKGEEKVQAINQFFTNYANTLSANGIPPKDIYGKCIKPTLDNFIKQAAIDEDIQTSLPDIINGVKEANKLNNINLDVLDPNWEYNARQLYKNAQLEQFNEVKQQYAIEQFKKEQAEEKAKSDFNKWFIDNPDATKDEIVSKIQEVSKDSPDILFSLTSNMKGYLNTLDNFTTRTSSPETVDNLILATVTGDLSADMIEAALPDLSREDGLRFFQLLKNQEQSKTQQEQRAEAQAQKAEAAEEKEASKGFSKLVNAVYKQIQGKEKGDILEQLNIIKTKDPECVIELDKDIHNLANKISSGELSYKEGLTLLNARLNDLKRLSTITQNGSNVLKGFKPIDLLNKQKRKAMGFELRNDYNVKSAEKAMWAMGLTGKLNKAQITSTMQANRAFDNRPHQGYDIGDGDIFVPKGCKARCIASGFHNDASNSKNSLGNYALMEYKIGDNVVAYQIVAHASKVPPSGAEFNEGMRVATRGNTGFSTGVHLHIEWFNPDMTTRMTMQEVAASIQGKALKRGNK